MHLFYQPNFSEISALTDDEAFHAAKVLRLREGEAVRVTDGKGSWFDAIVQQTHPKRCDLKIVQETKQSSRPFRIEIALAPTKNLDRVEWFVEKATEIGIDKISFFYTKQSERRTMKLERLQKIAVSAMKQSLQAYLPEIVEVGDFEKWILTLSKFETPISQTLTKLTTQKFIAHLPNDQVPEHLLKKALPRQNCTVLIGPEGDFTEAEIQLTQQNGFQMVTLGNTRLRTETAALMACHTLHTANLLSY
ncbi:16S rRNA (uracil(1498)-N(3))-methyltransferase [Runella sp.]|uniref:16S rRNA (uracil(1498)-N(3))-methyltransferase n=1 Tax=Runella sp. TaxID=1960881 RepID=UPI003017D190